MCSLQRANVSVVEAVNNKVQESFWQGKHSDQIHVKVHFQRHMKRRILRKLQWNEVKRGSVGIKKIV